LVIAYILARLDLSIDELVKERGADVVSLPTLEDSNLRTLPLTTNID
jgi:hypothetical protein